MAIPTRFYNGAIGMTYEQGGGPQGGLGADTNEGDTLTLVDRVTHHFTTRSAPSRFRLMPAGLFTNSGNISTTRWAE